MKDITEIKEMLDAFYRGQTSKEEEMQLRSYFSKNDLPEDMQGEKETFRMLFEQDASPIPEGIENRLSSLIDKLEKRESKKASARNFNKKKKLWFEIGGIAASICLLISIGLFVLNQGNTSQDAAQTGSSTSKLSPEDQKKIIEAQKALEMVSTNFNKGLDGIQSVSDNL